MFRARTGANFNLYPHITGMRNAILVLLAAVLPQLILAQAGTLDQSFNGDGLFVWDVMSWDDRLSAVVVQPDGKAVGAGWIDDGNTLWT